MMTRADLVVIPGPEQTYNACGYYVATACERIKNCLSSKGFDTRIVSAAEIKITLEEAISPMNVADVQGTVNKMNMLGKNRTEPQCAPSGVHNIADNSQNIETVLSNNAPEEPRYFKLRKRSELTELEKEWYKPSEDFINKMKILKFDEQKFGYHGRFDKYFAVTQSVILNDNDKKVTENGVKKIRCRLEKCQWNLAGGSSTKEQEHYEIFHQNDFIFVGYHETISVVGIVWHKSDKFPKDYTIYKILKTDIDFPYLVFEQNKCFLSHLLKEALFLPEREKIRDYVSNASDNDELKNTIISKQNQWVTRISMSLKNQTAVKNIMDNLLETKGEMNIRYRQGKTDMRLVLEKNINQGIIVENEDRIINMENLTDEEMQKIRKS